MHLPPAELFHATTVAIGGRGVLIGGRSGSGKSDLALRLIDRGAKLVSDDQTVVRLLNGEAVASAPATIAGKLEVRGLGVLSVGSVESAALALCVTLADSVERLPEPRMRRVAGVMLPEILLDPRPASAPIKVEMALAQPEATVA